MGKAPNTPLWSQGADFFPRNEDFSAKLRMIGTRLRISSPMTASLLLLLALSPQTDHRTLHPQDAPIYIAAPQIQAYVDAYGTTAVGRVIDELKIQALIEGVSGLAGAQIEASFEEVSTLSWGEVQSIFRGMAGVSVSLSELADIKTLTALNDAQFVQDVEARLVADYIDSAAATAAFDQIYAAFDQVPGIEVGNEDLSAGRLSRFSLASGGSDEGAPSDAIEVLVLYREGKRLALFSPASWARGWGEGTSSAATKASPLGETQGLVLLEADLKGGGWDRADPLTQALMPLAEGFMGPYYTMWSRGGVWRAQLIDGRYHVDGHYPSSKGAQAFGATALGAEPFGLTHPEAAVAYTTSLDGSALLGILKAEGLGPDDATIGQAFCAELGDQVTISVPNNVSVMAAPGIQFAVPLKDSARAGEALAAWMADIEPKLPEGTSFVTKSYRRRELYTFSILPPKSGLSATMTEENSEGPGSFLNLGSILDSLSGMIKPTVVVAEDRLLVTLSATHAKRAVRALAKGSGAAPLAGGQWPEVAMEVSHADWIQVVAGLYRGVKGIAGMMFSAPGREVAPDLGQEGPDSDAPPSPTEFIQNLPGADVFAQHFKPARCWETRTPGGHRYHSESSFGPEAALLAFGGLSFFLGSSSGD